MRARFAPCAKLQGCTKLRCFIGPLTFHILYSVLCRRVPGNLSAAHNFCCRSFAAATPTHLSSRDDGHVGGRVGLGRRGRRLPRIRLSRRAVGGRRRRPRARCAGAFCSSSPRRVSYYIDRIGHSHPCWLPPQVLSREMRSAWTKARPPPAAPPRVAPAVQPAAVQPAAPPRAAAAAARDGDGDVGGDDGTISTGPPDNGSAAQLPTPPPDSAPAAADAKPRVRLM